jgi:hypothetical protein
MASATLTAPPRSGSRELAQSLLAHLGNRLHDAIVAVDCSDVVVATPSFVDELVKLVLQEGGAHQLVLLHASDRTRVHAVRSAESRQVVDRLAFDL